MVGTGWDIEPPRAGRALRGYTDPLLVLFTMPLPRPSIKQDAVPALDELLHTVVDKEKRVPLVYLAAANVDEIIYEGQAGDRFFGDESGGKIDAETRVQLFSQTKFVTAVSEALAGVSGTPLSLASCRSLPSAVSSAARPPSTTPGSSPSTCPSSASSRCSRVTRTPPSRRTSSRRARRSGKSQRRRSPCACS